MPNGVRGCNTWGLLPPPETMQIDEDFDRTALAAVLETSSDPDNPGVIEPLVFHRINPQPGTKFYLELYR